MKRLIRIIKQVLRRFNNVFYVGSSDILPEPLSKEEEIKYVELFLNGDNNARNKLIEHNLRLVVFLAKKYENTKVDLEDLVSIGTIGLIKGVNTYKLDKNIKLATYASRCIYNEEFTQKEVADKLGISQSYISRIEKKVIKKLSQIINN